MEKCPRPFFKFVYMLHLYILSKNSFYVDHDKTGSPFIDHTQQRTSRKTNASRKNAYIHDILRLMVAINDHFFEKMWSSAINERDLYATYDDWHCREPHYSDVIMSAMALQITSLTMFTKYQNSASLAFVRGIHRWPVNSPHKGPVTRKRLHLMTSQCTTRLFSYSLFAMLNAERNRNVSINTLCSSVCELVFYCFCVSQVGYQCSTTATKLDRMAWWCFIDKTTQRWVVKFVMPQ